MNPAVDAANDQLAILYTRVDTPGRYCWVVYSLSEAKALPEETVTLQPLSYGGETESYPLRKDVTPEVRVRNSRGCNLSRDSASRRPPSHGRDTKYTTAACISWRERAETTTVRREKPT